MIFKLIKEFREYLKVTKQMAYVAHGNGECFYNGIIDIALLKDMIKNSDREIDVYMRDGTKLLIRNERPITKREIDWTN